jgi:hypothetical protein
MWRRLEPFERILMEWQPQEPHIVFSDRAENDFNTLAANISKWQEDMKSIGHKVSVSMVPGSFYNRMMPIKMVNIAFSFACLHHLEKVPQPLLGESRDSAERQLRMKQQSRADLINFLEHRAQEIIEHGSLILSFVGQSSSGKENYEAPVKACRQALEDLLQEGVIPMSVALAFEVPTYNRSLEDVRETLEEASTDWTVEELFEHEVVHPATGELLRNKSELGEEQASIWYGNEMVDWLMAVVAGYFIKALHTGYGRVLTEVEANLILDQWIRRTREIFLKNHRDEPVTCTFVYVRLDRL